MDDLWGWLSSIVWILSAVFCRNGLTKTQLQREQRSEAWYAHPKAWNYYHKLAIVGLCLPPAAGLVLALLAANSISFNAG